MLGGMTSRPDRIPLRPDYGAARQRAADVFVRTATAYLLSYANKGEPIADVLARHYRGDRSVELLTRAASSPATLTGTGWADSLAATATPDFLISIGPQSAGATVLRRCLSFQFDGDASLKIPSITSASANATFVGEGAPIPARQLSFDTGVTLAPRKFAVIIPFSREIFSFSVPNIETTVRAVLTESVGHALDAAMFSSTAADATRPAGLLVGIGATTPATAADLAMLSDVETLSAAVAPVAGNAPLLFVASPKQAARLRYGTSVKDIEVLSSSALSDKTVICIATNCVASAIDPAPRFDVTDQTTLHMDTVPLPLATGTGPTVASPIRSLWQTDTLGLKCVLQTTWGLRSSTGLAYMSAVNW
jgi:hypothetical protein